MRQTRSSFAAFVSSRSSQHCSSRPKVRKTLATSRWSSRSCRCCAMSNNGGNRQLGLQIHAGPSSAGRRRTQGHPVGCALRTTALIFCRLAACLGNDQIPHTRPHRRHRHGPDASVTRCNGLSRRDGLDWTQPQQAEATLLSTDAPFDLIFDATGALEIDGHRPEKQLKAIDANAMAAQFTVNAIGPGPDPEAP